MALYVYSEVYVACLSFVSHAFQTYVKLVLAASFRHENLSDIMV